MKASVLIITYNHERLVGAALASALAQEAAFEFEIVVSDDCSTDGTRGVIDAIAARHPRRVRVLDRTRNLGIGRNLAETLEACRGEYVALLEGDDVWTSTRKLAAAVGLLDARRDLALCFHPVDVIDEHGEPAGEAAPRPERRREAAVEDLLEENFLPTCSVVLRRSCVPALPAWLHEHLPADWPLFVLAALEGGIGFLPETMGAYRKHAGGAWTSRGRIDVLRRTIAMLDALAGELRGEQRRRLRATIADLALEQATLEAEGGERRRALATLARSVRAHPLGPRAVRPARLAGILRALAPRSYRALRRLLGRTG